jgi:4-amino-4-deoxy-L-arabinose transferase-like glycosyltransferase
MKALISFIKKNRMLTLIIFLGLILRLIDIARPFSGLGKWNEGHYAVTALNYFKYGIFLPMNEYGLDLTTSPLFSWLIYASFRVFGVHEWAARLPSLFFGMVSLVLVYYIGERLYDKNVALIGTLIAAVSPGIVYFSRNIQLESMFTAFTLAALLFLIYYKDTDDVRWLTASGIYLSIAILTKYPAILVYPALLWMWFKHGAHKSTKGDSVRLLIYLILPVIPSLLWASYAMSVKPSLTLWYVYKPEAPWMLSSALTATSEAVTRFIPEHFGYLFYYPLVIILPFLLRQWRLHAIVIIFTLCWLPLIFFFPDFYLANMYYHYTMLYGMAILLGYAVVTFSEKVAQTKNLSIKKIGIGMLVITLVFSLYQYNAFFHSYYTDFSKVNATEPFYSAKHVAEENVNRDLVVADLPMTMFYLGGDPEYIRLAYTTQGLINAVKEDKYTYLVTYYAGNRTLRETLKEHNYTQIAPRAWKRSQ